MTGLTSGSDFIGDVMRITIVDGQTSKGYHVHKHLLAQNSPYFAAITNFKEGTENHAVLEDMGSTAFQHILNWFYRGCLDSKVSQSRYALMETWAAADRLMMSKCKNVVMDKLRDYCKRRHSYVRHLEVVCRLGYSKENVLVRYVMDQVSWDCTHHRTYAPDDLNAQIFERLPDEMTFAFMARIVEEAQYLVGPVSRRRETFDDPANRKGCHYHEHVEGEECYLAAE